LAGSNVENLKKDIWKDAKISTRISFMLDKIVKEKGFEVSEEEIENGIKAFAMQIGMVPENAQQNLGPMVDQVIYNLKTEKAIQYLVDHAIIKIVKALENSTI
jgi:trigger factor